MIPIGGKGRCKTSLRMAITSQRENTLPRIVVGDGSLATEDGETRRRLGSGVVFEKIGEEGKFFYPTLGRKSEHTMHNIYLLDGSV